MTNAISIAQYGSSNPTFRNRIINGAMVIDQRNAGAAQNSLAGSTTTYLVDRWYYYGTQASKFNSQQNAGSVTPPVGFSNYLGLTSTSAYSVGASDFFNLRQAIEGFNTADLAWGTANAKTVTLSFWVYSSLTGTFGGVISNTSFTRCYPYTYTISSANTWTQINVVIAGDQSGTWATNNTAGVIVTFGLGVGSTYSGAAGSWSGTTYASATGATSVVGTSGDTFYITGVQLEAGSTATPFEYRQYGTELALCQRYYQKSYDTNTAPGTATTTNMVGNSISGPSGAGNYIATVYLPVILRTTPTLLYWDGAGNASKVSYIPAAGSTTFTHNISPITAPFNIGTNGFFFYGSNAVANYSNFLHYTLSAEL